MRWRAVCSALSPHEIRRPLADRLTGAGFGVDPTTSAEAVALIRAGYEKLRKLVVSAGLKAEK